MNESSTMAMSHELDLVAIQSRYEAGDGRSDILALIAEVRALRSARVRPSRSKLRAENEALGWEIVKLRGLSVPRNFAYLNRAGDEPGR